MATNSVSRQMAVLSPGKGTSTVTTEAILVKVLRKLSSASNLSLRRIVECLAGIEDYRFCAVHEGIHVYIVGTKFHQARASVGTRVSCLDRKHLCSSKVGAFGVEHDRKRSHGYLLQL